MVEMEVAHRHDVHALGQEADGLEHGRDPRTLVAPHRPRLVVEPLADPGLDQRRDPRRLDQQAVERLEQPPLVVDLVRDEAAPQDPRHGSEQVAGVRAERPRLDERDADVTAPARATSRPHRSSPSDYLRVGSPVARPASKSRWNADAVGSDWPWYFDPSSGEPYGRSTGLDILKKLIWPIRIPKYNAIGRLATLDNSSVRLPFQPGSTYPAVE